MRGIDLRQLNGSTLISVALGLLDGYIAGGKELTEAREHTYQQIAVLPEQAAIERRNRALNIEGLDGVRPAGMDIQEQSEGTIP